MDTVGPKGWFQFQLTAADRRRMEKTHAAKKPRLFEDNLPWGDPVFGRRFAQLTDVRHQYWGSPEADVGRLASLLSTMDAPDPHVVDLCCGAGRHALALAERKVRTTSLRWRPGVRSRWRTSRRAIRAPICSGS
jgi:tRNA G46 methylase TrmB